MFRKLFLLWISFAFTSCTPSEQCGVELDDLKNSFSSLDLYNASTNSYQIWNVSNEKSIELSETNVIYPSDFPLIVKDTINALLTSKVELSGKKCSLELVVVNELRSTNGETSEIRFRYDSLSSSISDTSMLVFGEKYTVRSSMQILNHNQIVEDYRSKEFTVLLFDKPDSFEWPVEFNFSSSLSGNETRFSVSTGGSESIVRAVNVLTGDISSPIMLENEVFDLFARDLSLETVHIGPGRQRTLETHFPVVTQFGQNSAQIVYVGNDYTLRSVTLAQSPATHTEEKFSWPKLYFRAGDSNIIKGFKVVNQGSSSAIVYVCAVGSDSRLCVGDVSTGKIAVLSKTDVQDVVAAMASGSYIYAAVLGKEESSLVSFDRTKNEFNAVWRDLGSLVALDPVSDGGNAFYDVDSEIFAYKLKDGQMAADEESSEYIVDGSPYKLGWRANSHIGQLDVGFEQERYIFAYSMLLYCCEDFYGAGGKKYTAAILDSEIYLMDLEEGEYAVISTRDLAKDVGLQPDSIWGESQLDQIVLKDNILAVIYGGTSSIVLGGGYE